MASDDDLRDQDTRRFMGMVAIPNRLDECMPWTGGINGNGYGIFTRRRIAIGAHRYAYMLWVGQIPAGKQVDHICHNRKCVAPDHLRLATNAENQQNLSGARSDNRSSGIRGVYWHKARNRWYVRVKLDGRAYNGGYFTDIADAEAAAIALRCQLFTFNSVDRSAS